MELGYRAQSSFPQTGSWNMVDLSSMPVRLLAEMFGRAMAARVQPTTLTLGVEMGDMFSLNKHGRDRVNAAVSTLPCMRLLGNSLAVGFSIGHPVRDLARCEGGIAILGLCAALQECYPDDVAVEILMEFAKAALPAEGRARPSNREWRALLEACAGALASSSFAKYAETLMGGWRHAGHDDILEHRGETDATARFPKLTRECPVPQSIAAGLHVLAKISKGQVHSAVISGSRGVGWLAAVAGWLVGLRMSMVDDNTDELLYLNYDAPHQEYQVQFRCMFPQHPKCGQPEESPSNNANLVGSEHEDFGHVAVRDFKSINNIRVEQTYRLTLDDATTMFVGRNKEDAAHVVAGRVEWRFALRRAFPLDFERLWEMKSSLGSILGGAARISQAIAMADEGISRKLRRNWTNYCDALFGHGFINNAIEWFPELEPLRKYMEDSMVFDLVDAKTEYRLHYIMLQDHCKCGECARRKGRDWTSNRFCEMIIAETIVYLCHLLANTMLISAQLLPMRTGLEIAYWRLSRCDSASDPDANLPIHKDIVPRRAVRWVEAQMCFNGDLVPRRQHGITSRLEAILELFVGRESGVSSSAEHSLSAMCTNGIIAFVSLLKDPECQTRNDVSKIYVVTGRIIFEERDYTFVEDSHGLRPRSLGDTYDIAKWLDHLSHRTLLVKEGSVGLRCTFHLSSNIQHQTSHITAMPSALAWSFAYLRGEIPCENGSRTACTRLPEAQLKPTVQAQNCCTFQIGHDEVTLVTPPSSSGFLAAVASRKHLKHDTRRIVRYIVDKECWDCCLRVVERGDPRWPTHYFFIRVV